MTNRIKSSIPYVSLLVAVVTAVALIWNGYISREHYRRIVKPMVIPHITSSPLDEKWGIFLKNEGSGPATVSYDSVTLDGRTSSIPNVLSQMKNEGVVSPTPNVSMLDLNLKSYFKEGTKNTILAFDPESVEPSALKKFHDFVHCRINVCYQWCSVYDECEYSCTAKRCIP